MEGNEGQNIDRLKSMAQSYGISEHGMLRCIEFAKAVDTIASLYGRDLLNCLLDRDRIVRLTHEEIVELATAIKSKPHEFTDIGDIIRAGDTGMIRYYLYQRQY